MIYITEQRCLMTIKILIVDDEPMIRDVLFQMLKISGYDTIEAVNGMEGLEIYRKESPDLIISDLRMPVMDGYEMCKQISQDSDVPIIMFSGQVDLEAEQEKRRAMGLKIDAVMSKPLHMNTLLDTISSVIKDRMLDLGTSADFGSAQLPT